MTDLTDRVMVILEAGRWVRMNELATALRVSRREIEEAIEQLRLAGEPIIAGLRGVCLTRDPDRLEQYVERRRLRLVSIYRGTRALRRTARRMRERTDLTLW